MTHTARLARLALLGAVGLGLGACSDQSPSAAEDVNVTMQQTDAILSQVVRGWYASVVDAGGTAAAIDSDTVSSLVVRVTDIEFLPKEDEAQAADDGAWIALELSAPAVVDLVTLPTEGESPIVIASGSVPVGQYGDVRLFVDSAAIVFKGPVALGAAFSFEGGTPYDVDIPSADQTGLKTDAEFTVEADADGNVNDVNLLFSPDATFVNVTATGIGGVILAPVIRGPSEES